MAVRREPMNIPKEHEQEFARFPAVLRELVIAELAAGNAIVECAHGFPAAPCGAFIKLALPVTSRPRQKTMELDFSDRTSSSYSGEFTDAKRHFFVLEPPLPPEPEPDMKAVRAEREARQRTADEALYAKTERKAKRLRSEAKRLAPAPPAEDSPAPRTLSPLVERFHQSTLINYERWHDGIGYDLELLKSATMEERKQIEQLLISGGVKDWRDVEALAALGSPRARALLRRSFEGGDDQLRVALLSHAPDLFSESERTAVLLSALQNTGVYGGLTQTMLLVESFHPPEIVDALLRGVLTRDGAIAGQFAAMLLFIHGKVSSPHDMEYRPFCLKFQDGDRRELFRELCERIGLDAAKVHQLIAGLHR